MYREFCMGIASNGNIFIDVNVNDPADNSENMERITTALTFQEGWNMVG